MTPEPNPAFARDWLLPDWPAPRTVRAVFTTRSGGVSEAPYDSMNLGTHVGDAPACVAANRAVLQRALGARAVFLDQVHGCDALTLAGDERDGLSADACVTTQRKLACTIMVADCLPILLSTEHGGVVAAAHAGWRGLAEPVGVLASLYAAFSPLAAKVQGQQGANKTIAWLGPCIGPSAFEVGAEVKAAFEAVLPVPATAACFVAVGAGKFLANLPALARLRLEALGLDAAQIYGNDGSAPWCTVSHPSRFFSHRRDAGVLGNGFGTTGRMAACIWLD
ncbi:laccase domain protein [Polaromonas sp.]|nr:laccase domain protein [Polaromonas sp.]